MTRINLVHPSTLCDQHLLAELRELPRIPNGVLSGRLKRHYDDAPEQYTLGKGHVKFFVGKLRWLWTRYAELIGEAWRRGFDVQHRFPWRECVSAKLLEPVDCMYTPTMTDVLLNMDRITERMPKNARMYGRPMNHAEN